MEIFGYIAALGAATCWGASSVLAVGPLRSLGAVPFNTLRMVSVALLISLFLLVTGRWLVPDTRVLGILALSGFVGIFLGDTLLFWSIKTLGPRMGGLLFATNAPISFVLAIFLLNESYYWLNVAGVIAVSVGVFIAITARSKAGSHHWEQSFGNVGFGIAMGFGAALSQSISALIIFDTMRSGQDPIFATMVRVWVAVLFLFISMFIPAFSGGFSRYKQLNLSIAARVISSGVLGMGVGMSLLLWAFNMAPLGIVVILSATTPVIVLPILWLTTKQRPSAVSAMAALVVVIGTAMIFMAT